MPPFVHLLVDQERLFALRSLGYANPRPSLIHLVDDPIAVERFVCKQGIKRQSLDQGRHAYSVVAVARQQYETNQIAERVSEGQDLCRPSPFRLAYSLTESPPFAPCPAR